MKNLRDVVRFARMSDWAARIVAGGPTPVNLPQMAGASQSTADERRIERARRQL
jgi:hypothetical protein